MKRAALLATLAVMAAAWAVPAVAQTVIADDAEVTTGSNDNIFSQNKQNEPGLTVNPIHPNVLVAGANDNIDMEGCNAFNTSEGTATAPLGSLCPFTPGVGVSGVQFSSNGGDSWTQPSYPGYSARLGVGDSCIPPAPSTVRCTPQTPAQGGQIGTLPKYYEHDLVSNGDPVLAFGPAPDVNGDFAWSNGQRLYYSNIATNFPGKQGFKGGGAIAVSRTDNVGAAATGGSAGYAAWMDPVIVTKQSSAVFNDKEAIWADNVESSDFFGNVYVCDVAFRSNGGAPEPVIFSRSTDGGNTWSNKQVTQAANTGSGQGRSGGRQGCQIRTDSSGVVYLFFNGGFKGDSVQLLARSFDGGVSFEKARPVATVVEVGAFDPVGGRFSFDGLAGGRTNSFPSVDIANGAPYGDDPETAVDEAPDTIALAWSDARNGLNYEEALVQFSGDGGDSWTEPVDLADGTNAENGDRNDDDRPDFPAIALSPDGTDIYVTYMGFLDPFSTNTSTTRRFQGVVRHADLNPATLTLSNLATLNRGVVGDGRSSSANALTAEFLGDYNSAVATNDFGAAVWTDDRNAEVCPAINAFRQALIDETANPVRPRPAVDCTPKFGNTDIYGGSYSDPTP